MSKEVKIGLAGIGGLVLVLVSVAMIKFGPAPSAFLAKHKAMSKDPDVLEKLKNEDSDAPQSGDVPQHVASAPRSTDPFQGQAEPAWLQPSAREGAATEGHAHEDGGYSAAQAVPVEAPAEWTDHSTTPQDPSATGHDPQAVTPQAAADPYPAATVGDTGSYYAEDDPATQPESTVPVETDPTYAQPDDATYEVEQPEAFSATEVEPQPARSAERGPHDQSIRLTSEAEPTAQPVATDPVATEAAEEDPWNSAQPTEPFQATPPGREPFRYAEPADGQPIDATRQQDPVEVEQQPAPPSRRSVRPTEHQEQNPYAAPRATPVGGADGTYVVQPRDNFWAISRKLYGSGAYYRALFEHNHREYPRADRLRAGDVLQTPSVQELEELYPDLCPRSGGGAAKPATRPVSQRGTPARAGEYVVEEGDSLYDIARFELGQADRWGEIYELNRDVLGENIDRLQPGTVLRMPPGSPAAPLTARAPRGQFRNR